MNIIKHLKMRWKQSNCCHPHIVQILAPESKYCEVQGCIKSPHVSAPIFRCHDCGLQSPYLDFWP